jgi:hypothetical protein
VIVKESLGMSYYAPVIGKWYDHALPTAELVIGLTMYHARGIVLRYTTISEILPMRRHVLIYQRKGVGQFSVFKFNALYRIGSPLPIVQDALHTAMSQAFKIDTLDLFLGYIEPLQKSAGLERQVATQDKTGRESTVETVETPALIIDFDPATLPAIRRFAVVNTTRCIK